MKNVIWGSIYLSLAASIWGGLFVVVKVATVVIPPLQLVWLRYMTALLALLFIGWQRGISWEISRRHWKTVFLIGLIGNTISIVTQETGTMLSSAQMGSVITASTPAFMVIFARLLLGEDLSWRKILSVLLASIGVLLIVIDPENMQLTGIWGGVSLCVAAITWALMSVLLKQLPESYSPVAVTTYAVMVAAVLLAPYSLQWLAETDLAPLLRPEIVGAVLYMGLISTAGGFILWNRGLQLMDASAGGLFFFFQPVVGTGLGWLLLGESITAWFWIGTLLVVFGVLLTLTRPHTQHSLAMQGK